jgi:hypothetical protein
MKTTIPPGSAALLVLVLALCPGLFVGCDSGYERYKPSSNEARDSLEAALSTWREGKLPTDVDGKPPVRMNDSVWTSGQQIESFSIGEEQDPGDGTKQFVVKLVTKPKKVEQEVKYIVQGRDPVYVYREDDYMRLVNMDNNPVTRPSKPSSRPSGRER